MPDVVLLTRHSPDGCYVAHRLAESRAISLVAVVTENRSLGQLQLLRRKLARAYRDRGMKGAFRLVASVPYLYWQDRMLLGLEKAELWPGQAPRFPDGVATLSFANLNAPEVGVELARLGVDYLLVYGTRILRRETYGRARVAALNAHSGITPEYRGSKSEFWALYNDDRARVGLTVHVIDDGIDTGEVLAQHYLDVRPGDDERSLRIGNIKATAPALEAVIAAWEAGERPTIDTSARESRYFSTPSPSQYMRLHRRLRRAKRDART